MKIAFFCLIVFAALLNFSCGQNVQSSSISPNEKIAELPKLTPTPEKYEKIYIIDATDGDDSSLLEFQDYKLEKVKVKKTDEYDNPKADIFDAVLTKNGKKIARFEGEYYPAGNLMSFGCYSFLGGDDKQLWISDVSLSKDGNDWIVSLMPKYEVIFDSNDFQWWRNSGFVDIEKDGILELLVGQQNDLSLGFASMSDPWAEVIFRYDAKTHKYLPASHILTEYSLDGIDERVKKFEESDKNNSKEMFEIILKYIYAGKENEAWKFFDENFSPDPNNANMRDKEQTKERIKTALYKDPIYKFISTNLVKNR